jgi:hypothetical protein
MRSVGALISRTLRAMKLLARDRRVPRPLRWLAGLALMPIPGPFDEAVLVILAPIYLVFYRGPMSDAWRRATRSH